MFDYHMHSNFSADCSTPMEDTIEAAIKLGLKQICFTEHIDYEYPDPTIQFDLDIPAYSKKIAEMQAKYAGKLIIKKGVEIGVQPYLLQRYKDLLNQEKSFDFIICSMHTANKQGLHSGDFFANRTIDEAYELYYEELLYCVQNFDKFNVLGHLDLVKRYTEGQSEHNFHNLIEEIFKVIIPRGQGIELNTSGTRGKLTNGMPSPDILKLYKKSGGEILTLGSDAHEADHVGYEFKESAKLLKSIGFDYITSFSKQKPTFQPIEQFF